MNVSLSADNTYAYETYVRKVSTTNNTRCLHMEFPAKLSDALGHATSHQLNFEFVGPDRHKYAFFSTEAIAEEKNGYRIPFPTQLNKIQRRKDFRIQTPDKTLIHIPDVPAPHQLQAVDISMGGTLGEVVRVEGDMQQVHPIRKGDIFRNIRISVPVLPQDVPVAVEKAEVVRLESQRSIRLPRWALRFNALKMSQKKRLRDIIYQLQRHVLRARLKP